MGLSNSIPNAVLQQGVCTSTTRPSSPYTGQTIYETDTGSFLIYYGTTTGWKPPWNQPWGVVAHTVSSSNTITSNYLIGVDTTFTAVANRRYRFVAHLSTGDNTGRMIFTIRDGTTAVFRIGDITASKFDHIEGSVVAALTAGSHTMRVYIDLVSGSNNMAADSSTNAHWMLVEDIGPATSTAPTA